MTAQPYPSAPPVVVGVDASPAALDALALAAWEAERRGTSLRLLHGYTSVLPYAAVGAAPYAIALPDLLGPAQDLLTRLADQVAERHPKLELHTSVVAGSPAAALIDASRDACLTVVGSRGLGGFAGLLIGSVSTQLSAHCASPLIVVRSTHVADPADQAWAGRPVVVGVDGGPGGDKVLSFAFEEASLRAVPLVALYAWWTLPVSNLEPPDPWHFDQAGAEESARRLLAEAVAGWCEQYPDVSIDLRAGHHLSPAGALLTEAEHAGLLVVGRHGGNVLTRSILASVSDMVLREAPCPVAVVAATED